MSRLATVFASIWFWRVYDAFWVVFSTLALIGSISDGASGESALWGATLVLWAFIIYRQEREAYLTRQADKSWEALIGQDKSWEALKGHGYSKESTDKNNGKA